MKEGLLNYDDLPLGSLWDGSPIRRTVNCDGCPLLIQAQRDSEALEICAWGVAWKVLTKVEKPRKCLKIGKEPPYLSSFKQILRVYENRNRY